MNRLLVATYMLAVSVGYLSSQSVDSSVPAQQRGAMLVAASRDDQALYGGIACCGRTREGTITVEPIARITKSGKWEDLPCRPAHTSMCEQFEREFLSRAHKYTVVSADGRGAIIHAAPSALGDCYEYTGLGTYSGGEIESSAIAASSDEFFARGPIMRLLSDREVDSLRRAVVASLVGKLGSDQNVKVFALSLEGHQLLAIEAPPPNSEGDKLIFAIGKLDRDSFHVLHWTSDSEGGEERVLGIIRLKSGRDYLITTVNDSESQIFRAYGILHGRIVMIYSGGGSSC